MAVTDLAFKLFAIDEASPVFDRVAVKAEEAGAAAETAGRKHAGAAAAIGKFASVGSAAAILVGGASLKMAAEFQEGLTTLVTGAGESEKNLKIVGDGIKQISVMSGSSTKELTDGMYMIESAGYHGKAGLDVLKMAAEGAKVGNAQLGDVANGVTTIMTDYKASNIDATQATNGLIKAVASGKTHMQDLAVSMATVAPIAATVHVSMNEMLGAMAELTSRGVPAAQAATMLKQTLINLKSPTGKAVATLHDLGLKGDTLSNMLGKKGLAATLEFLNEKFKENHLTSSEQVDDLKNISGGSKTLTGALILSGQGLEGFKEKTKAVTEATMKGKKGIEGWAEVQKDFNFKLDHFKAAIQVAAIGLGQQLLPVFTKLVDKISPFLPLIIKVVAALLALAVVAKIVIMVAKFVEIMIAFGKALRFAAVGMGILDGEMALNPFVAIAIAVIALGTAIYFVATKTQFFQTIWHAVWGFVTAVAKSVWAGLKVGLDGLMAGLQAVGRWATWLWTHAIKPTFDAIVIGTKFFVAIVGAILFVPMYLALTVLGKGFMALYTVMIKPAFNLIVTITKWLFNNGIRPIFAALMLDIKLVGSIFSWLYTHIVVPSFHGIVTLAKWLYNNGIKPVFAAIVTTIKDLGKWGTWLYRVAILPAVHGIATAARWLYTNGIKPVFAQIVNEVKTVGKWGKWLWTNALSPAFSLIAKGVRVLKDAFIGQFKAMEKGIEIPVKFTVNTVLGGMARTWNSIISKVGLKSLSLPVPHINFATGGHVQGPGGPTDDRIPAMLSNGEYVVPARAVRAMGVGFWDAIGSGKMATANQAFNGGGGAGGIPGFSGIPNPIKVIKSVGSTISNAVGGVKDWVLGTLTKGVVSKVLEAPIKALIGQIPGGGVVTSFMKAIVPKALSGLMNLFMSKNDSAVGSFKGGKIPSGQHKAILLSAMKAAGVPPPNSQAQWLTGLNTLVTRESGWNASAINRTDSNAAAGHPSQGLAQTIPGTFNAYVPASLRHLGILNPVANVAAAIRYIVSRYGGITRVQQANASMPPKGYAAGGLAGKGWSMFGENGPELAYTHGGARVLSNQRTSKLLSGVGGGSGMHHGTVEVIVKSESGKELERKLVLLRHSRGGRKFDWEK